MIYIKSYINKFTLAGFLIVTSLTNLYSQVSWPLSPVNQSHRIWHGYGTFEVGGGDHFHEGIDLPVPEITNQNNAPVVLAVENGVVVEKFQVGGLADYLTVSRESNSNEGWGYVHLVIGNKPNHSNVWRVGDIVHQGDTLGKVMDHSSLMDHLHFEYDNNAGEWHPDSIPPIPPADLNGDPLSLLSPNADAVAPTITRDNGGHFYYRHGEQEGQFNAAYFDQIINGKLVIKDNVDIIVNAFDVFSNHPPDIDYKVNVKKIGFQVTGPGNIPFQMLEEFVGLFLTAENIVGRNSFNKFNNVDRTHTIYENDTTAASMGSTGGNEGVAPDNGKYYYIVTNKDDDNNNEFADSLDIGIQMG